MKAPHFFARFSFGRALPLLFALALAALTLTLMSCPPEGEADTRLTADSYPARTGFGLTVLDGNVHMVGGWDNRAFLGDAWSFDGGRLWKQDVEKAPFPARAQHSVLSFKGQLWVIGGLSGDIIISGSSKFYNDVWSSPTGASWTQELSDANTPAQSSRFEQRHLAGTAVFNNKMWVVGGYRESGGRYFYNDVWSSSDGKTWKEELAEIYTAPATPNSRFIPRFGHKVLVYKNQLWVIGGTSNTDIYGDASGNSTQGTFFSGTEVGTNDVWSSPDGITWTQKLADHDTPGAGQFSRRNGLAAAVYDGKMWVIGGNNVTTSNALNDVWFSTDGVTWTQATAAAPFAARTELEAVEFEGKLWILGGSTKSANYSVGGTTYQIFDDAWSTTDGVTWEKRQVTP